MKSLNLSGRSFLFILFISGLTFCVIHSISLSAKELNAVKTVTAKAGLNVRATPDSGGSKLGLIPFGESVEITETQSGETAIAGKTGHWVKVKWKNINGWAFDAFLGDAASSPLLEHFKAIEIQIKGGCDCTFGKEAGSDRFCGECGSSAVSTEPINKPAVTRGNFIIFEYRHWECTNESYEDDIEGTCVESETKYYECSIDGKKILAVKKGETLETDVKCKLTKTE